MNHSGLIRIHNGGFSLTNDLLYPISIRDGSSVWCVYYPNWHKDLYTKFKHDFMFSPVPYDLWPYAARIKLRLKHEPGSLRAVSQSLKQKGLNILTSQCSRSGHRYATWSLIVDIETLHARMPLTRLAREVDSFIDRLEQDLIREHGDGCLFKDYGRWHEASTRRADRST